jgi:hypothetical protein
MRRRNLGTDGRFGQWAGRATGPDARCTVEPLQLSGREHRNHQHAAAAVGKIQPCAGAGRKRPRRRAKSAQPLQPYRPGRQQTPGKPCDLTPVRIGGAKGFVSQRRRVRFEQCCACGIGPQDTRAVARPQRCGPTACRMNRKPRIAAVVEFRTAHNTCMIDPCAAARQVVRTQRPKNDSLNRPLVSPLAGSGPRSRNANRQ